jgi:hypothetical protein
MLRSSDVHVDIRPNSPVFAWKIRQKPAGNNPFRLDTRSVIGVVIPAHNEASVIGRLLAGLLADAQPGEFTIVVVANGCTDDTERVATGYEPLVRVISTPIASKSNALRIGDENAHSFPRLYVDADVELRTADARALADALRSPDVLAVAPERVVDLTDRPLLVRWYYRIWQRLPTVHDGLFARGVIGVNEVGHQRLEWGDAMSDDLVASVSFAPHERRVVRESRVVVHPPRTVGDLLRRRVRAVTGTTQLEQRIRAVGDARTSRADLLRILRAEPWLAPHMMVFLAVTVLARRKARRAVRAGDFSTWLRDESSRSAPTKE